MINWKIKDLLKEFMMIIIKKNNIIILTTKGQKAVEEINSFKKDLEKDLVYNFTENEREIFKKLLNRLIHNFNSYIFK